MKAELKSHFAPTKNKTFERYPFHRIKQQSSEPFDDFMQKLKSQIKQCQFTGDTDEFLTDQIALGINSDTTRERLWIEENLTLKKAIKICRVSRETNEQHVK